MMLVQLDHSVIHIIYFFIHIIAISAECLALKVGHLGRSFTYTKNSIGPRTEPCGTPDVTFTVPEAPPRTTCCVANGLTKKKEFIQAKVDLLLLIP